MKFITVLLSVLAVFSPVVLSQQIDPFVSSAVGTTAKEADVSPMKNPDIFDEAKLKHITDRTKPLLKSIADKRELNDECMTFAFKQGTNNEIQQDDYLDVNGSGTTLEQYCNLNDCCHSDGWYYNYYEEYYDDQACAGWSKKPGVHYTVCPHSCLGADACNSIAANALDGSSIHLSKDSCSDGYSCSFMAFSTTKKLIIRVGQESCTKQNSCKDMAFQSTNLEELSVGKQTCTGSSSCFYAARNAKALTQLIIDDNQCDSSDRICFQCGQDSPFEGTFKLTEDCCAEDGNVDAACIPSSIPTTSNQPSILSPVPSGQPSPHPSNQPTTSSIPSNQHSFHPSNLFSSIPSISNQPSTSPVPTDADCKKFVNYKADDGQTTLSNWCSPTNHNCCQGELACSNWSRVATYEVCTNSCNNAKACNNVANSASKDTSIKLDVGSCPDKNSCRDMAVHATDLKTLIIGKNSCYSCGGMAGNARSLQTLIVESNACSNAFSCIAMALEATKLQKLVVGNNACAQDSSCRFALYNALSLKQLIIADSQCNSFQSCDQCGRDSGFDDTYQLTETCCAEKYGEPFGSNFDWACKFFDLTSNQPSISPRPSAAASPTSKPSSQPSSLPSDVNSKASKASPSLLFLVFITFFIVMKG